MTFIFVFLGSQFDTTGHSCFRGSPPATCEKRRFHALEMRNNAKWKCDRDYAFFGSKKCVLSFHLVCLLFLCLNLSLKIGNRAIYIGLIPF